VGSGGSVTLVSLFNDEPPLGFFLIERSLKLTRDFKAAFFFDFSVFMAIVDLAVGSLAAQIGPAG
jgi:hypothetical protein